VDFSYWQALLIAVFFFLARYVWRIEKQLGEVLRLLKTPRDDLTA